jgi:hypothetical protein
MWTLATRILSTLALATLAPLEADAQRAPDAWADATFATVVDRLTGSTTVSTNVDGITFWYSHTGSEVPMTPPGVVFVQGPREDREISKFIADGVEIILPEIYPYLTIPQIERIVGSKVVVAEVVDARNRKPAARPLQMSDEQKHRLAQLLKHGRGWEPGSEPWLANGRMTFVIDTRPAMAPYLPDVRSMLHSHAELRQARTDGFGLIYIDKSGLTKRPLTRGASSYTPPFGEEVRNSIDGISVPDQAVVELGEVLQVAASQRALTVVLFTTCDGTPIDEQRILEFLNQRGVRLIVVVFGKPEHTRYANSLHAAAEATGGGVVLHSTVQDQPQEQNRGR